MSIKLCALTFFVYASSVVPVSYTHLDVYKRQIIPTSILQIQTADKNKTLATEQVDITLKYDELKVNSPAIIIIKLMCIVVLGIDILTNVRLRSSWITVSCIGL